jgi:VIT1/CCC1 family predicted Fe2+/Mn2+ transporter
MHISEESNEASTNLHVWESTITTFLAKLLFASTFVVPVILLPLSVAIPVSIIWGGLMLAVMSYLIAKMQNKPAWHVVGEHLLIATIVIVLTHFVGRSIDTMFGSLT